MIGKDRAMSFMLQCWKGNGRKGWNARGEKKKMFAKLMEFYWRFLIELRQRTSEEVKKRNETGRKLEVFDEEKKKQEVKSERAGRTLRPLFVCLRAFFFPVFLFLMRVAERKGVQKSTVQKMLENIIMQKLGWSNFGEVVRQCAFITRELHRLSFA